MAIELNIPITKPPSPPPAPVVDTIPMLKYPPFPDAPEGVTIIPFSEFKPQGIKKFIDPSPDNVELDGWGVPTAALSVRHDVEKWKKKKRRMGEDEDGATRKYSWWEEWEKDESGRKMVDIDPSTPRTDRFELAAQEFRAGRPWPPASFKLQELFDTFRLYSGILGQPNNNQKTKTSAEGEGDGNDDYEDDEEEMEIEADTTPNDIDTKPESNDAIESDVEQDVSEAKRLTRMNAFLDDPEHSMAVFLSSYYKEKGMVWSETRCRDGPLLLMFFVSYLLRNDVFKNSVLEQGLRGALSIINLAKYQLPAAFAIGQAIPDTFTDGCRALWGSKIVTMVLNISSLQDTETVIEESDAKRQKLDTEDPAAEDIEKLVEAEAVDFERLGWNQQADDESFDEPWGTEVETAPGWGINPDGSSGATWGAPEKKSVETVLGPTSLGSTHTTGIVETSTRRVSAIILPTISSETPSSEAEKVEAQLESKLGKVVMVPWIGWDKYDKTDDSLPSINPKSRGSVVRQGEERKLGAHDPMQDEIIMIAEPDAVKTIIVGMGLGGTWVQIARSDANGEPIAGGKNMWYLENLRQMIPSYYTDP